MPAAAAFQSGALRYRVGGEKTWHSVQFGDGQESARAQRLEDDAEGRRGVVHVVHGGGGPYEVRVSDAREARTGVRFQRVDARIQVLGDSGSGQLFQHVGGAVHGRHLGGRELLQQGERSGSATGTEVHDPLDVVPGHFGDGTHRGSEVGREQFGIEVEQLREAVLLMRMLVRVCAVVFPRVCAVTMGVGGVVADLMGPMPVRLGVCGGTVRGGGGVRHDIDRTHHFVQRISPCL